MKNTNMYSDIILEKVVIPNCIKQNRSMLSELSSTLNSFYPTFVLIVARGTSSNAAQVAKYWIETFCGLPVSIAAPSIITKYNGKLNLNKALVIGISQSGAGEDICSVVERGNETGAITVAITNKESSKLAKKAQFHVNLVSGEETSISATKSFACQLCVLLILTAYLSENLSIIQLIDNIPEAIIKALEKQELVESCLEYLKPFASCSVVSRGFGFPIALELSNKLREVASIPSNAYSAAEFVHGPIACCGKTELVVLIDIGCSKDDDYLSIAKKLDCRGCQIVLITNNGSFYHGINCITLNLPKATSEIERVFALVPVIQLFACGISKKLGLNPDNVDGLSKVTITK